MLIRLRALRERLRNSLFWVPSLFVVALGALAQFMVTIDTRITDGDFEPPFTFTSTVDASRILLSTIAGATIAFAGVSFSIALLTRQLASTQFSPRLIQQTFRDEFDKRIIGFVVGTFAYCLVVLRAVRGPLEDGGTSFIPNLSTGLALVLGLLSVLAVVAFINHAAHQMDINELLDRLTDRSLEVICEQCRERDADAGPSDDGAAQLVELLADGHPTVIRSTEGGWVQAVDAEMILEALPPGALAVLWVASGDYAGVDLRLADIHFSVSVSVSDGDGDGGGGEDVDVDRLASVINSAVTCGGRRTFDFDYTYGIRQMVDVALKAMSPGINDPTTAHEAINRNASLVLAVLLRELPDRVIEGPDGRRLVVGGRPTHAEVVALAYDELRAVAAGNPTVSRYLLETLAGQVEALEVNDLTERADLLRRQARMIGKHAAQADMLPADLDEVRAAVERAVAGGPVMAGVPLTGQDGPSTSTP